MDNKNSLNTSSEDLILLNLNKLLKYLIAFFIFVIVFGFFVIIVSQLKSDNHYLNSFMNIYVRLFDLNKEANIPTWYSSLILIITACLLIFIGFYKGSKDINRKYWITLGIIFIYLSIDECAMIHEDFNNPFRSLLNLGGLFYWSWIVPAIFILIILFFFFFRFLFSLPKNTRNLFVLSALIFVGGAVGLEMIGGLLYTMNLNNSIPHRIETFFEETFEMSGILVFIYSLLQYIKNDGVSILAKRTSE